MYERHFGFSRPLFGDGLAQDEAVFMTEPHARLTKDLAIAFRRKDAVALLSGPSGCGKSTLAGYALRDMSTRLAFGCLSQAPLTAHELLEQLLSDFGCEPYKLSRVERLQAWRQFLSEMIATETRVCLLVENAESWSGDVLKALHGLTVADATQSPGANLVLTTTAPAEALPARPELNPLLQRVRLRRRLDGLAAEETRDYLAFKLAYAGAKADLLDAGAAAVIHDLSNGVIRVIDNLLESSLSLAAAERKPRVTDEIVRTVAAEHLGIAMTATAREVDERLTQATGSEHATRVPSTTAAPTAPGNRAREESRERASLRTSIASLLGEPSKPRGSTVEPRAPAAMDLAEIPTLTDPVPALDEAVTRDDPRERARDADERVVAAVDGDAETEPGDLVIGSDVDPEPDAFVIDLGADTEKRAERDLDADTEPGEIDRDADTDPDDDASDLDAIANARALEDISSSMTESVFGNDDFDSLVTGIARKRTARR